jgi:S-formylglutathione hydrolase FrmB
MKTLLGAWLLVGVHAAAFGLASTVPGHNCHEYKSTALNRKVNFCLHRSHPEAPAKGEPVVYFFHGMGGGADHWISTGYAEVVTTLARSEGLPAVTFVSFDTEGKSFFSDHGGKTTGGKAYESWFVKEFMPYVEKQFSLCDRRECRATLGLSMGGLGALKTALRRPDLFSGSAVNCPALPPFSAYRPWKEWKAYFDRNPIGSFKGGFLLQFMKGVFPNQELADGNDPSFLAENFKNTSEFPRIYFDAGMKDYYGFQEGYARLKGILDTRGIPYVSYLDPDMGHDISDKTRWVAVRFLRDVWLK